MLHYYGHPRCTTCRKARQWLDDHDLAYRFTDITQSPPGPALLQRLLQQGYTLRQLFNTSGMLYREMKLKDALPTMSQPQALALLNAHGMLCKRPIVTDGTRATVGFRAEIFEKVWGS